jgi:hypothetical protein
MRRILILLITGVVLTACESEPPAPASPSAPPAGAAPSGAVPSGAAPSGAAPTPSAGELPGGLPFGERTLTGTVERAGECAMLRVGERLWGLTGTPVTGLRDGQEVTVVGQVTTPEPTCGPEVTRGLVVQRALPV